MKKYVWFILAGIILSGSLMLVGCESDDVTRDKAVGAEIPRVEDTLNK